MNSNHSELIEHQPDIFIDNFYCFHKAEYFCHIHTFVFYEPLLTKSLDENENEQI